MPENCFSVNFNCLNKNYYGLQLNLTPWGITVNCSQTFKVQEGEEWVSIFKDFYLRNLVEICREIRVINISPSRIFYWLSIKQTHNGKCSHCWFEAQWGLYGARVNYLWIGLYYFYNKRKNWSNKISDVKLTK